MRISLPTLQLLGLILFQKVALAPYSDSKLLDLKFQLALPVQLSATWPMNPLSPGLLDPRSSAHSVAPVLLSCPDHTVFGKHHSSYDVHVPRAAKASSSVYRQSRYSIPHTPSTGYVLTRGGYYEEPVFCPRRSDGCQIVWALEEIEGATMGERQALEIQ